MQQDGKRPDGTTRGKPMTWDVTVPDTYAESHIEQTAREACSAANKAAMNISFPVAVEIAGTWNQSAIELIQEIDRRITATQKTQ